MGENIRKTEICNNCTPLIIEKILNLLSVMSVFC